MSVPISLCLALTILTLGICPAQGGVLENPGDGSKLSGLGFISGWKCNAGRITVTLNGGGHIPAATGQPRADTRIACGTINNGFITQMNWALLGDGTHTAVAYDDGVEFARSTFEVTTLGEEFVEGVDGVCRLVDFPALGETTLLEWNQATQHFEIGREDGSLPPAPPVFSDFELGRCGFGLGYQVCVAGDRSCAVDSVTRVRVEVHGVQQYVGPVYRHNTCFLVRAAGAQPTRIDLTALTAPRPGSCVGRPEALNMGIMSITSSRYGEPPVLRRWELAAGQTASMMMHPTQPSWTHKCQPLGEIFVRSVQPQSPGEWGECRHACMDPNTRDVTGQETFVCSKQADCHEEFLLSQGFGCPAGFASLYSEVYDLRWEQPSDTHCPSLCDREDSWPDWCMGLTRTNSRVPGTSLVP